MKFNYINVTLYNKTELLLELPSLYPDSSTEEFIEASYKKWGEHLFEKLNGDFAIAFYDQSKDIQIAARDPLGIKALYYAVDNNEKYSFSNDIDELFRLTKIPKKPNLKSMKTLLEHTAVAYEESMYEGICRVPPGHYLKITKGKADLVRYWFPEKIETNYDIPLEEASAKFVELFEKAILSRAEDNVTTACELSGGLDSSSVVSLLKSRYPQKNIDTYSMRFEGMACDESEYIGSVEQKYNFRTTYVDSHNIDYKKQFDFKFNYQANPHWPSTTTFTMLFPMLERIHRDKKRIVLTGQGGDHLLTGSCMVLGDLLKRGKFKKIVKEIRSKAYSSQLILGCSLLPLVRGGKKTILYSIFKHKKQNSEIKELFNTKNLSSSLRRSAINMLTSPSQSTLMDSNALHALENLYNVEFRHPFYDKDLVEFVLTLPPEYIYAQGWIKMLLRYGMKDILPEKIRSRGDKAVFSEVLLQQLETANFKKLLKKPNLVSLGLTDKKEIDRTIAKVENGDMDSLLHLWTIVNIEYWYCYTTEDFTL